VRHEHSRAYYCILRTIWSSRSDTARASGRRECPCPVHCRRQCRVASGLWAKGEDLRQYRKDYKVTISLTLDDSGRLFREFRVNNVPTVIVADVHGKIVQRIEPSDEQGLKHTLDGLM